MHGATIRFISLQIFFYFTLRKGQLYKNTEISTPGKEEKGLQISVRIMNNIIKGRRYLYSTRNF